MKKTVLFTNITYLNALLRVLFGLSRTKERKKKNEKKKLCKKLFL